MSVNLVKYHYSDQDFTTNKLLNARIHPLTTTERNALASSYNSNDEGVLVYDVTLDAFFVWDGNQWVQIGLSSTQIQQIQAAYDESITGINITSTPTDHTITLLRRNASSLQDSFSYAYIHTQTIPSDTWTVNHNLGKYPSVTTTNENNEEVIGDVEYINLNTVVLKFNGGFSGKAYLN